MVVATSTENDILFICSCSLWVCALSVAENTSHQFDANLNWYDMRSTALIQFSVWLNRRPPWRWMERRGESRGMKPHLIRIMKSILGDVLCFVCARDLRNIQFPFKIKISSSQRIAFGWPRCSDPSILQNCSHSNNVFPMSPVSVHLRPTYPVRWRPLFTRKSLKHTHFY